MRGTLETQRIKALSKATWVVSENSGGPQEQSSLSLKCDCTIYKNKAATDWNISNIEIHVLKITQKNKHNMLFVPLDNIREPN